MRERTDRPEGTRRVPGQCARRPENLDRARVAMTSEPRRIDRRQHPLKGSLGIVKVGGGALRQWQYEVTSGGRIWFAIDDENRTPWITYAGTGHPRRTDTRGR